jgi:hypothetical protein
MTTAPDTRPETAHTGHESVAHAVCRVCVPQPPVPGDKALCGHVLTSDVPMGDIKCVVCLDMIPGHITDHQSRGEFPS